MHEHMRWLRSLTENPATAAALALLAIQPMPVPAAYASPHGTIQYCWDRGEHHLQLDFVATGAVEWFYRNRRTEEIAGDDWLTEDGIDPEFLKYLPLFRSDPDA